MSPGFTSDNDALEISPNEINEVIDEEELVHLRELKELKKNYRAAFKELKDSKSELKFSQQAIDSLKQKLINCFEEWYSDTFEEETSMDAKAKSPAQTRTAVDASALSASKVSIELSNLSILFLILEISLTVSRKAHQRSRNG